MTTLQTRLAQADKPSRELDAAIAIGLGWRPVPNPTNAMGLLNRWFRPDGSATGHEGIPSYTSSVDAALTIVPEGWRVRDFGDWEDRWCVTLMHEETCETVGARSGRDQPALALAIACSKARGL